MLTNGILIKPISYMKANAATLRSELGVTPMFVTQNGEDSLVVQTTEAYRLNAEKMALMELLLQAESDIKSGDTESLDEVLASL